MLQACSACPYAPLRSTSSPSFWSPVEHQESLLHRRDIEALPGAPRTRLSLADSSQRGPASSGSLLKRWDHQDGPRREDSDGDMMVLDEDDAPDPSDGDRKESQQNVSAADGDGTASQDAGGACAAAELRSPAAAEGMSKPEGISPLRQGAGLEEKINCNAPFQAALRRQQQQQPPQQEQQPQPRQHTAGSAPAQPSHNSVSRGPSAGPHCKVRKLIDIGPAADTGTVPSAPPEAPSSGGGGGGAASKRQRMADAEPPEQHSKPAAASVAAGGPLSDDDGSQIKVAGRRSTGSNSGAGRKVLASGAAFVSE